MPGPCVGFDTVAVPLECAPVTCLAAGEGRPVQFDHGHQKRCLFRLDNERERLGWVSQVAGQRQVPARLHLVPVAGGGGAEFVGVRADTGLIICEDAVAEVVESAASEYAGGLVDGER